MRIPIKPVPNLWPAEGPSSTSSSPPAASSSASIDLAAFAAMMHEMSKAIAELQAGHANIAALMPSHAPADESDKSAPPAAKRARRE